MLRRDIGRSCKGTGNHGFQRLNGSEPRRNAHGRKNLCWVLSPWRRLPSSHSMLGKEGAIDMHPW